MRRKRTLLIVASAVVAAVGAGAALGTPPFGLVGSLQTRGAAGEFRIHDASNRFKIKAKEPTDVAVVKATLAAPTETTPAGFTGWHGHNGPSVAIVQSGSMKVYMPQHRRCHVQEIGPGQAFVHSEEPHNFVNSGTTPVEFWIVYFLPQGASPAAIDMPAPRACDGVK